MATRPWIILIQSRLPYRANRLSGKLLTHFVSVFPSYTRSRPYTAQKIKFLIKDFCILPKNCLSVCLIIMWRI